MLRLRFAAGGGEVVIADDFGPDESLLNVGVNCAARFLRRLPCHAACLINDSAGIASPLCSFQAMAIVSGRLRLRTS